MTPSPAPLPRSDETSWRRRGADKVAFEARKRLIEGGRGPPAGKGHCPSIPGSGALHCAQVDTVDTVQSENLRAPPAGPYALIFRGNLPNACLRPPMGQTGACWKRLAGHTDPSSPPTRHREERAAVRPCRNHGSKSGPWMAKKGRVGKIFVPPAGKGHRPSIPGIWYI